MILLSILRLVATLVSIIFEKMPMELPKYEQYSLACFMHINSSGVMGFKSYIQVLNFEGLPNNC